VASFEGVQGGHLPLSDFKNGLMGWCPVVAVLPLAQKHFQKIL